MDHIHLILKGVVDAKRLDRRTLAKQCGIGYQHLSGILNGRRPPSFKVLECLLEYLGLVIVPIEDVKSLKERLQTKRERNEDD